MPPRNGHAFRDGERIGRGGRGTKNRFGAGRRCGRRRPGSRRNHPIRALVGLAHPDNHSSIVNSGWCSAPAFAIAEHTPGRTRKNALLALPSASFLHAKFPARCAGRAAPPHRPAFTRVGREGMEMGTRYRARPAVIAVSTSAKVAAPPGNGEAPPGTRRRARRKRPAGRHECRASTTARLTAWRSMRRRGQKARVDNRGSRGRRKCWRRGRKISMLAGHGIRQRDGQSDSGPGRPAYYRSRDCAC